MGTKLLINMLWSTHKNCDSQCVWEASHAFAQMSQLFWRSNNTNYGSFHKIHTPNPIHKIHTPNPIHKIRNWMTRWLIGSKSLNKAHTQHSVKLTVVICIAVPEDRTPHFFDTAPPTMRLQLPSFGGTSKVSRKCVGRGRWGSEQVLPRQPASQLW